MTTTYLYVGNMIADKSINDVRRILTNAGFKPITISEGEVKLRWDNLSNDALKVIKQELHKNGYELSSICQTSWIMKPEGTNIL